MSAGSAIAKFGGACFGTCGVVYLIGRAAAPERQALKRRDSWSTKCADRSCRNRDLRSCCRSHSHSRRTSAPHAGLNRKRTSSRASRRACGPRRTPPHPRSRKSSSDDRRGPRNSSRTATSSTPSWTRCARGGRSLALAGHPWNPTDHSCIYLHTARLYIPGSHADGQGGSLRSGHGASPPPLLVCQVRGAGAGRARGCRDTGGGEACG